MTTPEKVRPTAEEVGEALALADNRVLVTSTNPGCLEARCGRSIAKRQDALVVLAAEVRALREELEKVRHDEAEYIYTRIANRNNMNGVTVPAICEWLRKRVKSLKPESKETA